MKDKIVFEKMHGIGNDFVLIDNRNQNFIPEKQTVISLADRHTGIGFDQLLLLDQPPAGSGCDCGIRFFNPDGSEAEQCGNGQRCVSKYLYMQNPEKTEFQVCGLAGIMKSTVHGDGTVTVNMGHARKIEIKKIDGKEYLHVNFANPHLVSIVNSVEAENLRKLNENVIQYFPQGVNLEIVEIHSHNEIKIRIYERGTGETQACGSGACAAVLALQHINKLFDEVKVILPGGMLVVESTESGDTLLTGEAVHVFSGELRV